MAQPGKNLPHGKGVFVGQDGWIWVQFFENGRKKKNGKFLQINQNTGEMRVGNRQMAANGSQMNEVLGFKADGSITK
jgi:hypothetical protein